MQIEHDTQALMHAAAAHITSTARAAIAERGRFTIALSGGDTPRPVYRLLATDAFSSTIDWAQVHVFWADERWVPPHDPASNDGTVKAALLDRVPLARSNVHRIHGEIPPPAAATAYEEELRSFFGGRVAGGSSFSTFDLVLLALGADGHTALLFPGHAAAREHDRWVLPEQVEAASGWRSRSRRLGVYRAGVMSSPG